METLWWLVAIVIMAAGLIGSVVPVIPGPSIIFGAAILHRVMVGAEYGMNWWGFGILAVLLMASYGLDFLSGYFGAKYFGATRWGVVGAILGGIAGIFTGFVLLLVLPIVGAVLGELVGGQRLLSAGKAGWGTLLGNLAGVIGKLAIGLAMVSVFLLNAHAPGA